MSDQVSSKMPQLNLKLLVPSHTNLVRQCLSSGPAQGCQGNAPNSNELKPLKRERRTRSQQERTRQLSPRPQADSEQLSGEKNSKFAGSELKREGSSPAPRAAAAWPAGSLRPLPPCSLTGSSHPRAACLLSQAPLLSATAEPTASSNSQKSNNQWTQEAALGSGFRLR